MYAQSNFATLRGRVQDPAQMPISGARVVVTAKATAVARQTLTNREGLFEAPNLVPGEYSLDVSATGFAEQSRDIVLEVGQHMGLDLSLELGEEIRDRIRHCLGRESENAGRQHRRGGRAEVDSGSCP